MPLQSTTHTLSSDNYNGYQLNNEQSFGPQHVLNIQKIREQLGCFYLSQQEILSMARDAIIHGFMLQDKVVIDNYVCHQFVVQNNMVFVLSEGFDAVVTIYWYSKKTQLIGDRGTTFQRNTNQQEAPQTANDVDYDIIDEIVSDLFENDADFLSCDHLLPPLPINNNNKNNKMPLQNHASFYSINTDDNRSNLSGGDCQTFDIRLSDELYNELYHRFYNDQNINIQSKQQLINLITNKIHHNKVCQMHYIGDRKEFCVWIDAHFVYITQNDQITLMEMFSYNTFQKHYGQCFQSLLNKINNQSTSNLNQSTLNLNQSSMLNKNASKRSIISINSTCNTSKRSVFDSEYHTIYLKPIIERMRTLTKSNHIDSDAIIEMVDNSIKKGVKRQISKRTFEFKYNSYTVIMSKSLKTILDVTFSNDPNIITVHPDVVSIISKKCPVLDYFTIQKVAKSAKLLSSFTTKKNDYRQQFIYDFCGCRIVFASNHTTIVEMQCNDISAINGKLLLLNKCNKINSDIK